MPEEIEVPTEHLHETVHEAAEESARAGGHESSPFNMRVALTTALLAVIAAVAALLAGHAANEAMLEQIEASDDWSHYQSKSIKATVLNSKIELLDGLGVSFSQAARLIPPSRRGRPASPSTSSCSIRAYALARRCAAPGTPPVPPRAMKMPHGAIGAICASRRTPGL